MKKFDFFSMFLVALLAFLGTEVKAQYKNVSDAKTTVNAYLQATPEWKETVTIAPPNPNASTLTVNSPITFTDQMVEVNLKRRFGQLLMKEFNNGTSVSAALDKLTVIVNNTSQTVPARGLKMAETETFYRNLLKL